MSKRQSPKGNSSSLSSPHDSRATTKSSRLSSKDSSKLSQQYGGRHTAGWVNMLPTFWVPYIQLARLSPPVGVCLVLFPHVFGFLHGILLLKSTTPAPFADASECPKASDRLLARLSWNLSTRSSTSNSPCSNLDTLGPQLIKPAALLVIGSFFLSNAIHGWNDLIDAPYDALVARTRERPVVRGAVSKTGALLFTVSQGVFGALLLAVMLPDAEACMWVAGPSFVVNFYYPWAKRHTHFAQYVLGVALAWGVVVGTAGVLAIMQPGENGAGNVWTGFSAKSTAALTMAAVLWTVIYDTIYAFQDRADDVRVGLKSTAVLFAEWTKWLLAVNLVVLTGLLMYVGDVLGLGTPFFSSAVGGCLLSLGTMIVKVDLEDPTSCWWWFRYGFWLAGGSIATGLLLEYIL